MKVLSFVNDTSTFTPVIRPTDKRFRLSFGTYTTSCRVTCKSSVCPDWMMILIVPHLFAVKDSLLAISIVRLGTEYMVSKIFLFPHMWLDMAESTNQRWVFSSIDVNSNVLVDMVTFGFSLDLTSEMCAIMMMFTFFCFANLAEFLGRLDMLWFAVWFRIWGDGESFFRRLGAVWLSHGTWPSIQPPHAPDYGVTLPSTIRAYKGHSWVSGSWNEATHRSLMIRWFKVTDIRLALKYRPSSKCR